MSPMYTVMLELNVGDCVVLMTSGTLTSLMPLRRTSAFVVVPRPLQPLTSIALNHALMFSVPLKGDVNWYCGTRSLLPGCHSRVPRGSEDGGMTISPLTLVQPAASYKAMLGVWRSFTSGSSTMAEPHRGVVVRVKGSPDVEPGDVVALVFQYTKPGDDGFHQSYGLKTWSCRGVMPS